MGLETAAIVMLAAAAAVSATGSIVAAGQAQKAGKAQQRAANIEAGVSRQQGLTAAEVARDRAKRMAASQRTAYLKSGVLIDGTASDVIYDSAIQGELDALNETYKGNIGAYSSMNRGSLARAEGNARATSSYFSAAGSVISAGAYTTSAFASKQPSFSGGTGQPLGTGL